MSRTIDEAERCEADCSEPTKTVIERASRTKPRPSVFTSRSMHHQTTISLALAGAIIADLEVTADRIDASLYAVEGWHPDLRRVVVIEGSAEAVLVSEVPLPDL